MRNSAKRFVLSLLLIGFFCVALNAQTGSINSFILDPYNPEYVENEILVKFKDEVKISTRLKSGQLKTGQDQLDQWLEDHNAKSMTKVFRASSKLKSAKIFKDWNGQMREAPQLFNIYRINFKSDIDVKSLAEELSKDESIEYAEPNYLVYSQEILNNSTIASSIDVESKSNQTYKTLSIDDPLYLDGSQAYLDAIHAPEAWELATGEGQVIAIIDTGVDWDHPDLDDNIYNNEGEIANNGIDDDGNGYIDDIRGWDFINNDNDPNDDNSHGTHVAGIAAAEGNNGTGIIGVAFNAKILPVKMLQSSGSGNSADLASAIEYASTNGATVINMSLGSYGESITVKTALENAYAGTGDGAGSIMVAAAGNDHLRLGPNPCRTYSYAPLFPASYSWVLGVMAEDAGPCNGFSNWDFDGPIAFDDFNYEIQAKGVGIMSCKPNGSYWPKSGTSMAAPEVAGAVALMRQYEPNDSGEEIFAKLIQGSDNGLLDINSSLNISLVPDLYYIDYTIVDTLPGCDRDGRADAGETIELNFSIKNAGGFADSVWSIVRFAEFEDNTIATIIDSTYYIGDISTYSSSIKQNNQIKIEIKSDNADQRNIKFEYEIGSKNSNSIKGEFIIVVSNSVDIGGLINANMTLYPNRNYKVIGNILINEGDTLFIKPGTKIDVNWKVIKSLGVIQAIGTPDSLVEFFNANNFDIRTSLFSYCKFESFYATVSGFNLNNYSGVFENCIFRYFTNGWSTWGFFDANGSRNVSISKCNFYDNKMRLFIYPDLLTLSYNNFISMPSFQIYEEPKEWNGNNIIPTRMNAGNNSSGVITLDNNTYYGSESEEYIKSRLTDFLSGGVGAIFNLVSFSSVPSSSAHGIVGKVNINNISTHKHDNPYDSQTGLGIVGSEVLKFDLYFNRAMDTTYTPLLTFGVREPYTQHIVSNNSQWSSDSTIWTAYLDIGIETGDGVNTVRVANAKDSEHFDIPVEDLRFEFVIQAAAAASLKFYATAGIGKVELEWPTAETDDALGVNMYRFYNLTDSTYSDTTLINTELILDTLYTDFNVIPDTTYHYLYSVVGTDMAQSDYSKSMAATPFDAANGDSNGDQAVNILDLTTIVSYILGQDPKPFLVDAADVNYDGQINVLDIISIVQLIMNPQTKISKTINTNSTPAYLWQKDSIIQLESENQVAVMQFELEGENLKELKLFSLLEGFEFSYGMVDGKLRGIFYSFNGNLIPYGLQDILRIENISGDLSWSTIFGGDISGNYVPILMGETEDEEELLISENDIIAFPNPFSHSITLKYQIIDEAFVTIELYNITGQKVKILESSTKNAGHYEIVWDGSNGSNQSSPPGIYVCKMIIKSINGEEVIVREIKIMKTK